MAGKLIVDTIDTDNAFITLNVQQSLIATMNVSGIYSNTGVKMIGANGTVSNTAITGLVTASQIANVANTQLTGTITGSQISSNTLSNTVFQTGSVENYMNAQGLGFGMRNRIINGAMGISQRNSTSTVTPGSTDYLTDRFHVAMSQSSKFTGAQSSTAPIGFSNSLIITSSSAYSVLSTDYFVVRQAIEGFNFADCGFGTASASTTTLSFWVRSSLTGTFGGALYNSAGNRSYPFSYTINAANTFEQKTITIAGDTTGTWVGATSGIGIYVSFSLGAGSTFNSTANAWAGGFYTQPSGSTSVVGTNGATFYITGVQLEKGSTATSFDYRPYTTELQLCERYCQRILGRDVGNTSSDWMGSGWNFTTTTHFTTVPLRTMLRSATGQSLYLSAAVGNYSVLNSSGTPIATSSMSIDTPSTRCLVITATVASGLTTGYPGTIYTGNSSSYYALITAEL